jgi:hypothetical protein
MRVRVLLAGAVEPDRGIGVQPIVRGIERFMLPGEDQRRFEPALGERVSERGQLDGFRPGPDDQPYVREWQPSP